MMITWACPKCGATPDACGKKPTVNCGNKFPKSGCMGFVCECEDMGDDPEHGQAFDKVCSEANCYHCGWGGKFPLKPKGLESWEKKALDAGWTPPNARAKEIGL